MPEYVLAFKPAVDGYGVHDPSAVIFHDRELIFGIEEERLNRRKTAPNCFPIQAIRACLDHCDIEMEDVDKILLPYRPELKLLQPLSSSGQIETGVEVLNFVDTIQATPLIQRALGGRIGSKAQIERRLRDEFGSPLPPVEEHSHHACHAASAFHPSGFHQALVVTLDGKGEYDSTVIWRGTSRGIDRIKTYPAENSLGRFYGVITNYLGYRAFNGEGKVMGLAPYGSENKSIESKLRSIVDTGVDYDVTLLTGEGTIDHGVSVLEDLFGKKRSRGEEFTDFHKDLAFVTQKLLEETVTDIVRTYTDEFGLHDVALAGGVALNCKMNKQVMEMDCVDNLFIQPVSSDAGLAVGAGMLRYRPGSVPDMSTVYWGPDFSNESIAEILDRNKIDYTKPDNLEARVAERIADGALVGWFQGRLEMGPRALGNRSILADPRTESSRENVNKYVKHREGWRPFAPSMLAEAAEEYLQHAEESPYMIKTFETIPEKRDEIMGVLHPGDDTTRPQTVRESQNPRYHRLLSEFERQTGVPVLLNTSFNDHGEPIVTTPQEAIKDFYGMGLDVLVLEDYLLEK